MSCCCCCGVSRLVTLSRPVKKPFLDSRSPRWSLTFAAVAAWRGRPPRGRGYRNRRPAHAIARSNFTNGCFRIAAGIAIGASKGRPDGPAGRDASTPFLRGGGQRAAATMATCARRPGLKRRLRRFLFFNPRAPGLLGAPEIDAIPNNHRHSAEQL
ncbi:hypothetical protein MTO96_031255 [Rhipicephalus appendiculatus]